MEFPDEARLIPGAERNRKVLALGKSFMHVHPRGFFVRALLPVRLSDGHEFHFGVWLETSEENFRKLRTNWERLEYSTMRFEAKLANSVPPWNDTVLAAACVAGVRDPNQLPYIESSSSPRLALVMATPWPRAECEKLLDQVWAVSTT